MDVPILDIENAPENSKPWLEATAKSMGGFLPNLYRQMANAPMVLETYLTMSKLLSKTSFTFAEQQLILLTASAHNGCKYCVAAHSSGARMAKLDRDAIDAVREGRPAEDTKLEALRCFVEEVMETRGKVSEQTINQFLDTGYNETQVMELMIGLAMKDFIQHLCADVRHPPRSFECQNGVGGQRSGLIATLLMFYLPQRYSSSRSTLIPERIMPLILCHLSAPPAIRIANFLSAACEHQRGLPCVTG